MTDGDPCVGRIEREPSQETFDQRGEYSYSVRVDIPGSFFRIDERIDASRDIIARVGR